MGDNKIYETPTVVTAKDGAVVLDGPDGVDLIMSAEAAAETSDRLLNGAAQARGQQLDEARRGKRPE